MTYDHFFKRLMQDFLTQCKLQLDVPVGKLPLKIDLVIKCPYKFKGQGRIPILETNFAEINLIEYKSSHDIPKNQDLAKLIGYLGLYCNQNKQGIDVISTQFTIWYISAKRPSFINNLLEKKIITPKKSPGLYQLQIPFLCPYFLLIINELDISEDNLPLLLLSSGKTLRETIPFIFKKEHFNKSSLKKYLSYVYLLNYKDVSDMTELQSSLPASLKENIKLAIHDIGIKEVWDQRTAQGCRPQRTAQGCRPQRTAQGCRPQRTAQGCRPQRTAQDDWFRDCKNAT
ncbi:MAG: hypothetical protein ACTSRS_11685 [Candidatus Helarchaeota archaeon]